MLSVIRFFLFSTLSSPQGISGPPLLLSVSANGNHKIPRRNRPRVLHRMPCAERDVQHTARPNLPGHHLPRNLMLKFKLALSHQDELRVLNYVRKN